MAPGAPLARIVQKPLRDVFPDDVAAIVADRIDGLDFDGPLAAPARDPQHVALDLHEPSLPHLVAADAVRGPNSPKPSISASRIGGSASVQAATPSPRLSRHRHKPRGVGVPERVHFTEF